MAPPLPLVVFGSGVMQTPSSPARQNLERRTRSYLPRSDLELRDEGLLSGLSAEKETRQRSAHNKSFCSLLRNSVNQREFFLSVVFCLTPPHRTRQPPQPILPPLLPRCEEMMIWITTTCRQLSPSGLRAPLARRMMLHYEPVMKQPLPRLVLSLARPPRHPIMILRQTRRQTRRSVPIGRTVARERCRLNVDRICCLVHFRHENNCRI